MENLAEYIYSSLERIIDMTDERRYELYYIFNICDAYNKTVDDFRNQYGLDKKAGVLTILPLMVQYAEEYGFVDSKSVKSK